ncbi:MAG: right-handed parallel beta-helix repeat-containing protein [bacterium]
MNYVKRCYLIIWVATLLLSQISFAAVIRVPQDQPTIQAGIDAASDGDTVLVDDGIWTGKGNKVLKFGGKAISVQSKNGSQACIIDCEKRGRGVTFDKGETNASIFQGFTIRNGLSAGADGDGGAILCTNRSSPSIKNCVFEKNHAGLGGGIFIFYRSHPLVIDCAFIGNSAQKDGGGIYCQNNCSPSIMNCVFENNFGRYGGGGISLFLDGHLRLLDCAFIGNSTEGAGGGIQCGGSSITIFNCLFDGNSAAGQSGGVGCYWESPEMTIINSSIVNNTSFQGGGVYVERNCTVSVVNSILWGNTASNSGDAAYLKGNVTLNLSYCNVENGTSGIYCYGGGTFNWGDGMIDSNPKFVPGPDGNYYLSQIASGQSSNSPCVDAGSDLAELICESFAGTNYCMNDYTTRTDGVSDSGQVDMGYHNNLDVIEPTPTPTPTSTPIYTPTPEPTPECDYLGSRLVISQEDPFRAGDTFWLECHVCNNTDAPMREIATAVLLGVYGEFWFWPGWTQNFEVEYHHYEPGLTEIQVLEPFIWPHVEGHAEGLEFYSGLINAEMTDLIGDFGYLTFGYTDR